MASCHSRKKWRLLAPTAKMRLRSTSRTRKYLACAAGSTEATRVAPGPRIAPSDAATVCIRKARSHGCLSHTSVPCDFQLLRVLAFSLELPRDLSRSFSGNGSPFSGLRWMSPNSAGILYALPATSSSGELLFVFHWLYEKLMNQYILKLHQWVPKTLNPIEPYLTLYDPGTSTRFHKGPTSAAHVYMHASTVKRL